MFTFGISCTATDFKIVVLQVKWLCLKCRSKIKEKVEL